MRSLRALMFTVAASVLIAAAAAAPPPAPQSAQLTDAIEPATTAETALAAHAPASRGTFDDIIERSSRRMIADGRRIFRYDTFGTRISGAAACACTRRSPA